MPIQRVPILPVVLLALLVCPLSASAQYRDREGRNHGAYQEEGPGDGPVDTARQKLRDAERRVRATWKADSNYIELQQTLEEQQQAFEVERDRVIAKAMKDDPDYREMRQQAEKLDGEIDQLPEPSTQPDDDGELDPVDPERSMKAEEKLDLRGQLAEADRRLIDADEKAAAAKKALDQTKVEFAKLQAELDKLLLTDSGYRQAKEQLAQARRRFDNR